ncbi:hypothetical protein ACFL0T_05660 [Candidatus Omnitrophota bacterium]
MLVYITIPALLFFLSLLVPASLKLLASVAFVYFLYKSLSADAIDTICKKFGRVQINVGFLVLTVGILILIYADLFFNFKFVWDWIKHRSVLISLYNNPMAPTLDGFNLSSSCGFLNKPLIYYYAMYLPSVYIVKLFTLVMPIENTTHLAQVLSCTFFTWNLLGIIIVFCLLPVTCNMLFNTKDRNCVWGIFFIAMIVFTGLDYWFYYSGIPKRLLVHVDPITKVFPGYFAQYRSVIHYWQFYPMQLVASGISVVFLALYSERMDKFPLFLVGMFLIGSATFCFIGAVFLILFFLIGWLFYEGPLKIKTRALMLIKNVGIEFLLSLLIGGIVVIFYIDKVWPETLAVNHTLSDASGYMKYLFFLVKELFLFFVLGLAYYNWRHSMPGSVLAALVILILMPLFSLGKYNDLAMKGCIPALFFIILFCASFIQELYIDKPKLFKFIIILYFFIAIPSFMGELFFGLSYRRSEQLSLLRFSSNIYKQYVGSEHTFNKFITKMVDAPAHLIVKGK